MFLRRLLQPKLHAPPFFESRIQYERHRFIMWGYVSLWMAGIVFLWIAWFDLPYVVRIPLGILEFIFAPDFEILRVLFYSYDRYIERKSR